MNELAKVLPTGLWNGNLNYNSTQHCIRCGRKQCFSRITRPHLPLNSHHSFSPPHSVATRSPLPWTLHHPQTLHHLSNLHQPLDTPLLIDPHYPKPPASDHLHPTTPLQTFLYSFVHYCLGRIT